MQNSQQNNKRIAKNTMALYVRMIFVSLVSLYTSRIVLNTLGIEDYGIYDIVGSVVVMFSFISGPLGSATQRFLNYELGKEDGGKLNLIFNLSLYAYLLLAIIMFLLLEIGGTWYIGNKMNLPPNRIEAAQFAFQFSLLSFLLSLLKTPFEATVIAYERMSYYAHISIVEVILKLGNAYSLLLFGFDKLKVYAINQFAISLIIFLCLQIYCHRQFVQVRIRKVWDGKKFKELLTFSMWTFVSSISTMAANQGVNIVLNLYTGVVVNAAMGIATQVNSVTSQLVSNFQTAFNPQIVKYYSSGDLMSMQSLAYRAAKFSYLILFIAVCPLFFNIEYVLELWLKNPPHYAGIFCVYLMVWALLEALMASLWTSITATGKIRNYHIAMSVIISFVFLGSWLCLSLGMSPVSVMVVKCLVDVILIVTRLMFANKLIGFSIMSYFKGVIKPVSLVTIATLLLAMILKEMLGEGILKLVVMYIFMGITYIPLVMQLALSKNEKAFIITTAKSKINNFINR